MTGRRLAVLPAAPFARHQGRHRRRHFASHGSTTGWAALAHLVPAQREETFTKPRRTPLVVLPLAQDELIPFADYRHPYSPKDAA
ncbi:hypothetical protein FXF51_05730 [Nonomuraea sp. PA05]|uniref:hypothetical protein n=1 Tax=Nonomuraea sp. PA05 TaxID=2604466 RepID=UPI0011D8AFBA|nr:hypothetical protein [Nonomuraea sp. PA05]TYB69660.1 hypothetical protein FXF51_05730 [Nonomuraea sp. PA05]